MALEAYRKKRHFNKTPEPGGEQPSAGKKQPLASGAATGGGSRQSGLLYVIQKHAARRLHYDLRLELGGVLLSWAVPKGPSLDPHDRRLAARVEDHPLEYGSFEGIIPKGEYGAGTVELWDRGTWEPEGDAEDGLKRGDLKFTLHGEKLKGSWGLVRMKPRSGQEDKEDWLLIKHGDDDAVEGDGESLLRDQPRSVASGRTLEEITAEASASVWHGDLPASEQTEARAGEEFLIDPSRLPGARQVAKMPPSVQPELASLVKRPPEGEQWLHEVKFDGYRALARIESGTVKMYSRNQKDLTGNYRVLVDELAKLPVDSVMLDGEVVVQLPDGTTNFQELQNVSKSDGSKGAGQLLYYVFDLLYLNGYELLAAGIEERKELLKRLLARSGRGSRIVYSEHISGEGRILFEQACRLGLEGVVSKRAGTRYRPGVRGGEWLKSKCSHEQEFVIGGFTDPAGTRTGFGALLLGTHESEGLRYVGKVGTGFSEKLLGELGERLRRLEIDAPPFTDHLTQAPKRSHWVKPELVAEVAFSEWTRGGAMRHPSFKGLREDKPPSEVVREVEAEVNETPASKDPPAEGAQAGPKKDAEASPADDPVHAVTLTHLDRVFWPLDQVTKRNLVHHYEAVAKRMLPYVLGRPIAMVRCPDGVEGVSGPVGQGRGREGSCFFYKHPGPDFPGPFERVSIQESGGPDTYLTITEAESLTGLAQMGVLEIHVWGSTWPDIEHPDMLVFDLDPDSAVEWAALAQSARLMREVLQALGLESFVKTTGGKGLHVVVPISALEGWEVVRRFCKSIAEAFVSHAPERYTATMSKEKRAGKIYIDYMRNNRGSTSIAPYSTRAREHATIAVPLRWSELSGRVRADTYTINNLQDRLRRLKADPWDGYFEVQRSQTLTTAMKHAVGIG